MKTLVITLMAIAFFTACEKPEEEIIKAPVETTLAKLEWTFRDSGHVTFTDNLLIEFDTVVYQHYTFEWDATYGADLKAWGFNLDGIGDSVAIINLYIENVIDTTTVSTELSNSTSIYYTLQ